MLNLFSRFTHQPGAAPGIEHDEIVNLPGGSGPVKITCLDYCPANALIQEVDNLEEFLERHRPEWAAVRWIKVDGLSDRNAIHALATKYDLHPLAIEDLLHTSQRPKVEAYGGQDSDFLARLFIVIQAPRVKQGSLQSAQFSIFVGHNTVLTFQQENSEIWDAIIQRIKLKGARLRSSDASFLAYSLLDAAVDSCFPILEYFSDRAEALEVSIQERSHSNLTRDIHQLKRDLLMLHRLLWPMREVVSSLQRDPHECMSETTRVYLRDLYDHVVQLIEIIETYRQIANDLTDTHLSSISNRMNEVMKVLTLISTIFIPLTFLAGVYGMNFHHFPELDQVWAYPAFWIICLILALIMLAIFRRRRWL